MLNNKGIQYFNRSTLCHAMHSNQSKMTFEGNIEIESHKKGDSLIQVQMKCNVKAD